MIPPPPSSTRPGPLFPYPTPFRSSRGGQCLGALRRRAEPSACPRGDERPDAVGREGDDAEDDGEELELERHRPGRRRGGELGEHGDEERERLREIGRAHV